MNEVGAIFSIPEVVCGNFRKNAIPSLYSGIRPVYDLLPQLKNMLIIP
jgi:hypothetical protein